MGGEGRGGEGRGEKRRGNGGEQGWDDSRSRSTPTNTRVSFRVSIRVTISESLSQSFGRFFWRGLATDGRRPWLDNSRRIAPVLNSRRIAPVLNSRRAAPHNIRVTPSHSGLRGGGDLEHADDVEDAEHAHALEVLDLRHEQVRPKLPPPPDPSHCKPLRVAPSRSGSFLGAPGRSESRRVAVSRIGPAGRSRARIRVPPSR